jgi:DNA-binding GntR family transcriptional regulator
VKPTDPTGLHTAGFAGPTQRPNRRGSAVTNIRANARDSVRRTSAQSLTDRAYLDLEEMIVTLKLPPGTAVSESELSQRLRIGRTPIREALQRLARERLIVILPRRGILVSEINVKSQLRLLEVRREVERLIARSAARRATAAERERFRALARMFEKSAKINDDVTFMRTDREFNVLCATAARNEFAAGAMIPTRNGGLCAIAAPAPPIACSAFLRLLFMQVPPRGFYGPVRLFMSCSGCHG